MRIALITIHRANNYGAVLQAFATQHVLSRFGSVEILDHENKYIAQTLTPMRMSGGARALLRFAKDLVRVLPRRRAIKKFNAFIESRLNLRPFRRDEAAQWSAEYDVFVSGSDQIWNPVTVSADNTFDPNYFLDFVQGRKKISYASSMGSYKLDSAKAASLAEFLTSYDSISAREKGTAETLAGLIDRPVAHLLDPTLLVSANEWREQMSCLNRRVTGDYAVVFALKKDSLLRTTVSVLRKNLGLRVVVIDQDPILGFSADEHIMDAGPDEFIDIFLNARFVITNSFHGTAFAINFGVPFAAVLPPSGGNRIESLLEATHLKTRLIGSESDAASIANTLLDFTFPHACLEEMRKVSIEFLSEACRPSN